MNSKTELRNERQVVNRLYELLVNVKPHYFLREVYKGKRLNGFREIVRREFGLDVWPLVEPDIILRFEDISKLIDENLIVGVEVKYIKGGKRLNHRIRSSFRMIGQPLRFHIFGFDSAVLWHVFSEDVSDDKAERYTSMVNTVIEKLHLPIVYLASKLIGDEFRLYKPFSVERSYDASSIVDTMRRACESMRNPAWKDEDVRKFRRGLKVSLGIP